MPARSESRRGRGRDSLNFWIAVIVICGLVGLGGYAFGKKWLGARLHQMEVGGGAPEISPEVGVQGAGGERASEESPPVKPIIVMREREPSAHERREVERELAEEEPQDGAQLHAREAEEAEPEEPAEEEDEAPAEPPRTSTRPPSTGRYVVTAGSFANEDNVRAVIRRLSSQGYQPYTTAVEKDGVTFRRINVAVCKSREQAEELQTTLKSQGFDSAVRAE